MTKPKILHLQMVFHWWHRCAPLQISMTLQHKHMENGKRMRDLCNLYWNLNFWSTNTATCSVFNMQSLSHLWLPVHACIGAESTHLKPSWKIAFTFSMFDILCLHSFATWTDTGFKENTRGFTRSLNPYYEKRPLPRILCLGHNNFISSPSKTAMEVKKEQFGWYVGEWSIKGRDNK